MKIKEQECQVGKIATIHRGVLTEKLVIFTHLFCRCHTYSPSTHIYIHTYYRVHTWSSPSHGSNSVAAVRRRRQLLKRKGESKISECVCAQCYYLLDSYVYVCPHAIFYALLNFFLSNFYRDILVQTIHNIYGKIDCSVSCSKNQGLVCT